MRNTGIIGRLVAATLAAVFAVGCGGNGKESARATTSTTQAASTTSPPTTTTTTASPSTTAPAVTTTTKGKPATTPTTGGPKLSPTQFFVAKPGCKNEIDFVRVGADRKVAQSKAVVKAAGNTQLIAYSERDDRLLYGAYNCDTKTKTISEIALNDPRATPKLIASDLDVVDADYDYKNKAVLVLTGVTTDPEPTVVSLDSASGARTVRWRRPAAWKNTANPYSTIYPSRLRALTGGEIMIGGDGGKKFVVARVSEGGYTSGGVTGDGDLATFDISILQGAIALSIDGSPDLYLCAFDQVYGASQATPIASAPGCASNPLPQGLTSAGPKVAWAFSGQDGHNLLLAIKDQAYLLDVESFDLRRGSSPPKVYGRATTNVPYGVYVVSVYVSDRDLSKTLPTVTV